MPDFHSAGKEHGDHQHTHDGGNRHIRFQDNEHAKERTVAQNRKNPFKSPRSFRLFPDICRRKQNEGKFCNFRGLYRQRAYADPALGAVIFHAQKRNEHQREQNGRENGEKPSELFQFFIGEICGKQHSAYTERNADRLLFHEIKSVAVRRFGRIIAGGINKHTTENTQKHDCRKQIYVSDPFIPRSRFQHTFPRLSYKTLRRALRIPRTYRNLPPRDLKERFPLSAPAFLQCAPPRKNLP